MVTCFYWTNNPSKIYMYDGRNIIKYDKDIAPGEEDTKYLPYPRESFDLSINNGTIKLDPDCQDAPMPGGRRSRRRKSKRRKSRRI